MLIKQCTTNLSSTKNYDTQAQMLRELFYKRSTVELARSLLGKTLVRIMDDGSIVSGTIVETEAYLGVIDGGSHSYRGRKTPKTEPMFMAAGTAYVYHIYFQYYCFNISSNGKYCGHKSEVVLKYMAILKQTLNEIWLKMFTGQLCEQVLMSTTGISRKQDLVL